jgi:hypothetical protein
MLKKICLLAAVAASALAVASPATAAPKSHAGSLAGFRCVAAGVDFLVDNNLLRAAAARQIDYDTIDSDSGGSEGLINTDLPAGSFLPLGAVIRLHFTNPGLFDWCA